MPPLGNPRSFRLLGQERRLFPADKIPTGAVRRHCQQIGVTPASGQVPGPPSDRHVDRVVAVLVVVEDATLSLSMKRTPWTSQPS